MKASLRLLLPTFLFLLTGALAPLGAHAQPEPDETASPEEEAIPLSPAEVPVDLDQELATPQVTPVPPEQPEVNKPEAAPTANEPEGTANDEDTGDEGDLVAENFLTRCAGCHTIGGGAMKGPDLTPATQWSTEDLKVSIRKMVKHAGPIEEDEVVALTQLLQDEKLKARLDAEKQRSVAVMAASLDAPDAKVGAALFFGSTTLANGGMSCSSCHRVGIAGGDLGPDLTELKDRMPRVAMLSAFEGANFPVMRPAYATHPVTKQEALHLAGYFEALDLEVTTERDAAWLLPLAAGSTFLFLVLIGLIFKNNGPAGTRARLVSNAQREA